MNCIFQMFSSHSIASCVYLHDVQLVLQMITSSSKPVLQCLYQPILHKPNVAFSSRASFVKASACGESGLPTTVGLPASASEQICGCSGISPSNVIPSSAHFFFAPGKSLLVNIVPSSK